jgi:hypothetical protein
MSNIYEFVNIASSSNDVKQQLVADTIQANNLILKDDFEINNLTVNGDLHVSNDATVVKRMVAEDIECNNMTCITHTVDNLFTQNITVDPPETIINVNSPFEFNNNDISGVGTLTATTIIGNIQDDIIDVNQINPKDNPEIQITGDLDMNANNILNCTDIYSNTIRSFSTSDVCFFNTIDLQNNDLFRADEVWCNRLKNIGGIVTLESELRMLSGTGFINMNGENITNADQIEVGNINSGGGGDVNFSSGINMANNDINNIDNLQVKGFIQSVGMQCIEINTCLDVLDHDIDNVKDLTFQTVPTNDDTETRLLVLNTGDNKVEYRNVSSLPAGNPFDQSLNTNDSPTFNALTTNGVIDIKAGIQNSLGVLVDVFGGLDLLNNSISNVGFLTAQKPIFTSILNDNTATEQLYLDGSNNVVSRIMDYSTQSMTYEIDFNNLVIGAQTRGNAVVGLGTVPAYIANAVDSVTLIGNATLVSNALYNIQVHFGRQSGSEVNENNEFMLTLGSVNNLDSCSYIANCDIGTYTSRSSYSSELNPKCFTFDTSLSNLCQFLVRPITIGSTSLAANSFVYRMFVRISRIS